MTRRKEKKLKKDSADYRKARIDKLIALGWISSEREIPHNAIPVDPELINLTDHTSAPLITARLNSPAQTVENLKGGNPKINNGITKPPAP